MNVIHREKLRQRSDYTHKFNTARGRHGWLRLTPAYSVKVVEELMERYAPPLRVLDPFCGTATTALSAAYHGHEGVTTDINPFLIWLGQAKTARYSRGSIGAARGACARIIDAVERGTAEPAAAPPIHGIERWWRPAALQFLRALKAGIEAESEESSPERVLLRVAFCRTLIKLSNAAFNHQSMSFKDDEQLHIPFEFDMGPVFAEDVRFVLEGAGENPEGTSKVVFGDARNLQKAVDGRFDLVITSPPYANRMSYIRELRPYMYWLGFLNNSRDAGELDRSAIGGTWGVATSSLVDWRRPAGAFEHPMLDAVLNKVAHSDNKSGKVLANYIAKYFEDIRAHFNALAPVLVPGAELHYIVGNSKFYDALVPVERLYAAMLEYLGFERIECRAIRKRNSKRELVEFDISARWPGRERCKEEAP